MCRANAISVNFRWKRDTVPSTRRARHGWVGVRPCVGQLVGETCTVAERCGPAAAYQGSPPSIETDPFDEASMYAVRSLLREIRARPGESECRTQRAIGIFRVGNICDGRVSGVTSFVAIPPRTVVKLNERIMYY